MKKRIICLLLVSVLCLTMLTACGKKKPTDVAVKIGSEEVTREELLFYFAYYEAIGYEYGLAHYDNIAGFWDDKNESGVTNREFFYTTAFAELSYMTIMSKLAKEAGITLTDSELEAANKDAESFYNDFTDEEKKQSGITLNGFKVALVRQSLVGKYEVYLQSKLTVDEEGIKAKYKAEDYPCKITECIRYKIVDDKGNKISDAEMKTAKEAIAAAAEKLKSGMSADDVVALFKNQYSLVSGTRYIYADSTSEKEYIEAASKLTKNEVCDYVECASYIYTMIMTDDNSSEYFEYIVSDAIQKEYDAKMSDYYEKIAASYTRTVVDAIISSDKFGSFCIITK